MSHVRDVGSCVAQRDAASSPGEPPAQPGHGPSAPVAAAVEDRRAVDRRLPREVAPDLTFGIRVVVDAKPIDMSPTGILAETSTRLRPGGAVELVLHINGEDHILRATVVRSYVYSLDPTVFRTAFNFDQPTTLPERKQSIDDSASYAVSPRGR